MKFDDSILENLSEMLEDASAEKLERVRLLIEKNTKVSQEVKDGFFAAIDSIEPVEENSENDDNKDVPEDLVEALAVDGMAEYIASVKEEAYNKGLENAKPTAEEEDEAEEEEEKDPEDEESKEEAEAEESEEEEAEEEEEATETEDSEEDKSTEEEERVREVLVDSIVQNAVALRCSEINLEDIGNSSKEYKESLIEKNLDELKTIFRDLSHKMTETFVEAPTESLDDETLSEDKPDGLDKEEDNEGAMSDARKVIRSYLKRK